MNEREVIIIGAGPAGYSAAIYLARAALKPLMLAGEQAGGQLMLTTEVENFPGFKDGIQGPELMAEMRAQAEKFGAEIKDINVTRVDLSGRVKFIWTEDEEYQTRAVLVSTGAKAKMLGVGEERLLGRGVSTCAVCDAAFYQDKQVFVVGGGDAAMEDALALTKFADKVTLIHRRDEFRASKIMQERVLNNDKVAVRRKCEVIETIGENKLEAIRVRNCDDGRIEEAAADGLFMAIGHTPVTELFLGQLEVDEKGYLKTAMIWPEMQSNPYKKPAELWLKGFPTQTSKAGVFGAGDVVDFRYRQAITAAAMGTQAALDIEKLLTGRETGY